jgi:hypothetical protein
MIRDLGWEASGIICNDKGFPRSRGVDPFITVLSPAALQPLLPSLVVSLMIVGDGEFCGFWSLDHVGGLSRLLAGIKSAVGRPRDLCV